MGAGLWARPGLNERQAAAVPPPDAAVAAPTTARKLQVVVDDRPAPLAAPIQVLPAVAPRTESRPLFDLPQLFAPKRPPEGLIRADAPASTVNGPTVNAPPVSEPPPPAPPRRQILKTVVVPAIAGAVAATDRMIARAEAPKARPVAVAAAAPPPPPHRAELRRPAAPKPDLAKARAAQIQLARAQAAKVQAAKAEHRLELAQAAKAKAAAARAEKAEQVRLAAAEAKGRAEAREQARQEALADARKRVRLAALAHALARALPHRAHAAPVEVAQVEPRHHRKGSHEGRVEQASLKTRRGREAAPAAAHVAAARPMRARPEPMAPQPGSGLVRVSATSRCARSDPGEALVCADPGLGAADRQLSRAYQSARAAGVPDAQLRSQQQRWLAARSAAAREAPWAVRDVYMARIAELNGQAREAQTGY